MRVLPTLVVLTVLAAAAAPASARPSRPAQELPPRVAAVAAASAGASARAAELAPCDAPDGPLCGTVQVPLDRADPSGPSIGIHFEVVPHGDTTRPPLAPIFAVAGGPGLSITQAGLGGFLAFLFGPVLDRRDLVTIDYRGTGLSQAVDCASLQGGVAGEELYPAVADCGRQLGDTSDLYGAAAVAGDVEAVRDALGADQMILFGQSYGGLYVQAYGVRHPDRLESAILDAPVPLTGYSPYFRTSVTAALRAVARICQRSVNCRRDNPHAARSVAEVASRLRAQPLHGTAFDAAGDPQEVDVTEATLAKLVQLDTGGFAVQSEIAAATRALRRGDALPLLRLAAESGPLFQAGGDPPEVFSDGMNNAGYCTDQTFPWDKALDPDARRAQLDAAILALSPTLFGPFSKQAWLAPPPEGFTPDPCIGWPAPTHDVEPPLPPGAPPTDVPALLLTGDLDLVVPSEDSVRARRVFPKARVVRVAAAPHNAIFFGCSADLVLSFIATGSPGDTSCARTPAVSWPALGRFPRVAGEARQANVLDPAADDSTAADRRIAFVAADTVTDAMRRVFTAGGTDHGRGLRGGTVTGEFTQDGLDGALDGARFAEDVGVTGSLAYAFETESIDADVAVDGPGTTGRLRIQGRWNTFAGDVTVLTIDGTLGGRAVSLSVPAE